VCIRAGFRGRRFDYSYPALAVVVLALALVRSGVLQARVEAWNFRTRLPRRTLVLDLVRAGKLQPRSAGPCDCFYADLPPEYADMSAGHEVLVSRHTGGFSVTFFVGRSPLFSDDDYSAFIFRSNEGQPQTGEEDTYSFYQIRPIQQHWFFVRHT
jgi:hypothetical protein